MRVSLDLWRITCADLIVRTAYQVGKTPLMPLFAASLGAGELLVGAIVSVSTMTGMVLKPIFGWLSDRWGRRLWLLTGLVLFSGMPFLYSWVNTPEELFALRLLHGLATAVFGPVTLAFVAEMAVSGKAERLGWFGMARSGSYLLAPLLGAWLLTWMDPATVFTLIGFISCLAFLPVCMMDFSGPPHRWNMKQEREFGRAWKSAFSAVMFNSRLWVAGVLEMLVYLVTYSIKAFLPLYALYAADFNLLAVGLFFTVQEAAHFVMRPVGGRFGDQVGYLTAINAGYLVLVIGLSLLPYATAHVELLVIAVVIGAGQGLIFPSTVAFVGRCVDTRHLGAGMGFFGAVRNFGKVAGPLTAGVLLTRMDYSQVFHLGGTVALLVVLTLLLLQKNYFKWNFLGS
ncbi:MAG TPA: MFS transporter [Gammaproteobacteria bacterium]|jgi:MFS family permease|nr:MFS transporter [Arenicellales bacterium]MDP6854431.1 MFS transporter [Arenicellales bacterium]MDP6948441.1 MFS transporter [Arenicellales bacterium]HCY13991.1 MFS transporter [Gammaproteobacteria bacterium]|tara:strand:- start:11315 stop:12511 length:1197 start_codon:yes stop_codon:yes gene_type:complete